MFWLWSGQFANVPFVSWLQFGMKAVVCLPDFNQLRAAAFWICLGRKVNPEEIFLIVPQDGCVYPGGFAGLHVFDILSFFRCVAACHDGTNHDDAQ